MNTNVSDPYDYPKINAIKIIVYSEKTKKVLLLQEPSTNEWMPNHWGLPGGKPIKNESLEETVKRKVQNDIGNNVNIKGLFRIEELIQGEKTIHMFIYIATVVEEFIPKGEFQSYKWINYDETLQMDITEFTEYYNPVLISDFFNSIKELIPNSIVRTWNYNQIDTDKSYSRWIESNKK